MNLYVPAPFPYATPLSAFILPYVSIVSIVYFACAFISVYATHIVPLPLSCNHYFHSTCPACPYKPCPACPYKPLLSLRIPCPLITLLSWLLPFDACLLLSYHQYSLSHASPSPLSLSFSFVPPVSFLAIFLGTDLPNENENGQDSKVSGEVPYPSYPFRSSEKINTRDGHYQRLLGT